MTTTEELLIGVLGLGAAYLAYKHFDDSTPVLSYPALTNGVAPNGVPSVAPMIVANPNVVNTSVPIMAAASIAPAPAQVYVRNYSLPISQEDQVAPEDVAGETPVDHSGQLVNGQFPPNSFSSVATAAGEGSPTLAGNTLLSITSWNKYRKLYSAQHGNCCPEVLANSAQLITSAQYRALLGR